MKTSPEQFAKGNRQALQRKANKLKYNQSIAKSDFEHERSKKIAKKNTATGKALATRLAKRPKSGQPAKQIASMSMARPKPRPAQKTTRKRGRK